MSRFLIAAVAIAIILAPGAAQAASFIPIVPCGSVGQEPCTPCHLFQGLKNATDMVLYGITGPIAAFMIVLAGGRMLLGGANPSNYSNGKTMLTDTLMGVSVILVAWVATNFLVKSVAVGSDNDSWYEFTCPQFLADIEQEDLEVVPGGPGGLPPRVPLPDPRATLPEGLTGSALFSALAAQQNPIVPYPRKNSDSLNNLISCIYRDPIVAALTFPKPVSSGIQASPGNFTYDNSHEICNYTRGSPIGGRCSHGAGSCHYGGSTGSDGAEAIDFNAPLKTAVIPGKFDKDGKPVTAYASEQVLFCELYRVLVRDKKCGDFGFINFEQDGGGAHTHVSTKACKADRGTIGGLPPKPCTFLGDASSSSSGQ